MSPKQPGVAPLVSGRAIFRSVLIVTLVVVLSVAVAACGGGGDDSGSTSGDGSTAGTQPSDLSGQVTIWDPEYEAFPTYKKATDKIDAEFEQQHPEVTLEIGRAHVELQAH